MVTPIPHGHITHKLKRSLLAVVGLGLVAAGLLALTVSLINYNIEQTAARSKQLALDNVTILLEAQQKFSLPEDTSYVPSALDPATLVTVVAKNQPAVVRIVAMYCADIALQSTKSNVVFDDRCGGKVGSGSFISSDGYIATSGHVATVNPKKAFVESLTGVEDIDAYLGFLVTNRYISSAKSKVLKSDMAAEKAGAQEAFDATIDLIPDSQFSASAATMQYAVQLSNIPIQIDEVDNRLDLRFGKTVIEATLIDQDFDEATSDAALASGQFTSSDVALLKAEGSFPFIRLGSIETVKPGDQLTAIGFPSAINGVDSELTQQIPSITQGKVKGITKDANVGGRNIIATTVPIGQGNSGGPAINDSGEQIGLNTYSVLECPDLKCYGDGQVRDIADIKALLDKNGIRLQAGGVSDDWSAGLDAYVKGDYNEALRLFTKVQAAYPANYLVPSFLSVARAQVGSATDASSSYQARTTLVNALIVLAAVGFIAVVVIGILIIHFTRQHRRQS